MPRSPLAFRNRRRRRARDPERRKREAEQRIEVRTFAGPSAYVGPLDTPLRIVHITDQHVGFVTPHEVQKAAVRLANAENPDLIVLTGDFVCHSQAYLDALGEVIGGFEAPVMGVLGNHDHWSGADEVRWALRNAGCEVLDNVHTTITLRNQRLQVVGLDDAYTSHADREAAVKGLNPKLPSLALSHIAEEADALWAHGIPLVLSGHTHAGQLTVARLHELTLGRLVGHKYVHGLYGSRGENGNGAEPTGAVYVGAGIGAAVMPLRMGNRGRREVTVFELGVEPGSIDEHHEEQDAFPGRKPTAKTRERRVRKVQKRRERRQRRAERKSNGKSEPPDG